MSNIFKAFIPVGVPKSFLQRLYEMSVGDRQELGDQHVTSDPAGSSWRASGLVESDDGYFREIQAAAILLTLQFNDRNLPASVINEHTSKRIAKLAGRQGYKLNRKQAAEVKEEIISELLPKAFIKRSAVPILICNSAETEHDIILICTGSAKRYEDAMGKLNGIFGAWDEYKPWLLRPENSVVDALGRIAREKAGSEDYFEADNAAVLIGEGKRTIRIKDRDIYGDEVQELLGTGYDVREIALTYYAENVNEDPSMTFTITDKLIFKRVAFGDHYRTGKLDSGEDFHAFTWLVAKDYIALTARMFDEFGGIKANENAQQGQAAAAPETNDEDEL